MRYWRRAAPPFAFDSSLSLSVCDFNAISRQWRRGRGFTSSPRGGTAFRIQIDERVQPSSFLPFFLWKWNVADGLVLPLGSPSLNAHLRTNPGMSKKDKQYWGAEWSAPWPPTRRHSRIVIAGESFALSLSLSSPVAFYSGFFRDHCHYEIDQMDHRRRSRSFVRSSVGSEEDNGEQTDITMRSVGRVNEETVNEQNNQVLGLGLNCNC